MPPEVRGYSTVGVWAHSGYPTLDVAIPGTYEPGCLVVAFTLSSPVLPAAMYLLPGWGTIYPSTLGRAYGMWKILDGTEGSSITFTFHNGDPSPINPTHELYNFYSMGIITLDPRSGGSMDDWWYQDHSTSNAYSGTGTQQTTVSYDEITDLDTDSLFHIDVNSYNSGLAVDTLGFNVALTQSISWDPLITQLATDSIYSEHVLADDDPRLTSNSSVWWFGHQPVVGGVGAATSITMSGTQPYQGYPVNSYEAVGVGSWRSRATGYTTSPIRGYWGILASPLP